MSTMMMSSSWPWEVVLDLVCHHLDPKTLAIASCVSKSWFISMSSDHLWNPICTTHFPSLSALKFTNPTVPYHRLYVIGLEAAKRRVQQAPKPQLSLSNLIFTINIFQKNSSKSLLAVEKAMKEVTASTVEPNNVRVGVFKFDIDVDNENVVLEGDEDEMVRVTWNVVLEGWRGIFGMMDFEGKGVEGCFWEELPWGGCCSRVVDGEIVADLKLGFSFSGGGGSRRKVKKVSVGMLSVVNWRYVSVDDALRNNGVRKHRSADHKSPVRESATAAVASFKASLLALRD